MGGPGHDDVNATLGCGSTYTSATPTLGLVAASMSRTTAAFTVSLQVVDASPAMPPSDVKLAPGFDGAMEATLASSITLGQVAPNPPFSLLARAELGPLDQVKLRTYLPASAFQTSEVPLPDVLAHGDVTAAQIVDAKGFALIALGAYPGVAAGPFWHAFTYTLVEAYPDG
jgi:hypothetical protein